VPPNCKVIRFSDQRRCNGDDESSALIGRALKNRLGQLEALFEPLQSEPFFITINYVDTDGTVVDSKEIELPRPPLIVRVRRASRRRGQMWPGKGR